MLSPEAALLELGIAILGGLVVAAGAVIWRRLWNPVRWRFVSQSGSWWYLERVSGPRAIGVTFGHRFSAPPILSDDRTPDYPQSAGNTRLRFRDIPRGQRDLLDDMGLGSDFYMFWAERGHRVGAQVRIPVGASTYEMRRRDVLPRAVSTALARDLDLDVRHHPD